MQDNGGGTLSSDALAMAVSAKLHQHLHAAVYTCDTEGRVTWFNEEAAALWGRRPEIGKELWCGSWRIYSPVDGSPVPLDTCPMAIAVREKRALSGEIVVERTNGERLQVKVFPEPLFDEVGRMVGAINLLLDVTGYKDAGHIRGRLAAIVESSEDAIASEDLNGVITSWNRGAEAMYGYRADEVVGQHVTVVIPAERHEEAQIALARVRNGQSVPPYQTVRRCKNGRLIDVSLTVSPIRDADGSITGAAKIARDITEWKRAEQALAEADRRKDEFIAVLAHELRNPLAPLRSALQLARLRNYSEPMPRATFEMMERQVGHLVRLVEDLLDVSRLTNSTIELHRDNVDLSEVIRDACEMATPQISRHGQYLQLKSPMQGFPVEGDRTRLVQIVTNLLSNAAKFSAPDSFIEVALQQEGKEGCIRVKDHGVGIPRDKLDSIFEMFTQVGAPVSSLQTGMGIGLALARKLAENHGGSLTVRSGGPGRGSEFTLRIPLNAALMAPAQEAALLDRTPPRRILIVDDNRDAANALATLLRMVGHETSVAYNGLEALDVVAKSVPDVVLLDLGLPDISGQEVARRLVKQAGAKRPRIIALMGWNQDGLRGYTASPAFDGHLVKPVHLETLQAVLLPPASQVKH